MKWLITGGGGFIGSNLVHVLQAAGCQVFVFDGTEIQKAFDVAQMLKSSDCLEGINML